jgi:hypothetical protein
MIYNSRGGGSISGEDVDVIEEVGLVPYRKKPTEMTTRSARESVSDAEYNIIDENDNEETESLTSEQISRMSPTEIEDFRRKRIRDFQVSLGISYEKAQKMADAEIDPMIEGKKQEKEYKEIQTAREKAWDERSKDIKKPEVAEEQILEEPKTKIISEVHEIKLPQKEKEEDLKEELSIVEKMFGKKKEEVPLSPKELRIQRIQKSKEEHLRNIMNIKERERRKTSEISLKNIGRGDMGAKSFGGSTSSKDFFGMNKFIMGEKTPLGKEKIIEAGLPSTKLRPLGNKPPSTSFGGGVVDISSIVNVDFGSKKIPEVSVKPVTLKQKISKQRFVKPMIVSFGFSNEIPDINESLSLGTQKLTIKNKKQVSPVKKPVKTKVAIKNPVEDFGMLRVSKNPIQDWEFGIKPLESKDKKERSKIKKQNSKSLDFLEIKF